MPQRLIIPGLLGCRLCDTLTPTREQVVPGFGVWPNKVMFVGEAPGGEEEKGTARPFVGLSGKLLKRMCTAVGINLDTCYRTNLLHCRPPGNRDPSRQEVNNCNTWLMKEIEIVDPDIIVCVGGSAYKAFMPEEESSITSIRGSVFEREIGGRTRFIVPTFHPAFVLRNERAYRRLVESDLKMVRQLMVTGVVEKPIEFTKTKCTWEELVAVVNSSDKFGLDLEYDGPADAKGVPVAYKADIVGVGICAEPGKTFYYPCADHNDILSKIGDIREVLESKDVVKVVSNVKAEKEVLRRYDIELTNYRDTLIEAWLLGWVPEAGEVPKALKDAWHRFFGTEMRRIDTVIGKGKDRRGMRQATIEDEDLVVEYAAQDPDATLRLHNVLYEEIRARNLEDLYLNIEMPFTDIIIDMETAGMGFDPTVLEKNGDILEAHIKYSEAKFAGLITPVVMTWEYSTLEAMASKYLLGLKKIDIIEVLFTYKFFAVDARTKKGMADAFIASRTKDELAEFVAKIFNPGSHDQTAILLYGEEDKAGFIPNPKRGGKGPTDKVTLADYVANPIVKGTLEVRATRKLLNTYVKALPKYVDPADGRIHANISQTGTQTGRVSSYSPNLTNIPAGKRGDIDNIIDPKVIREAFVAKEGNYIYSVDLSQIEMRQQAHVADVKSMKEVFFSGGDIHDNTTTGIFEVTLAGLIVELGDAEGAKDWNNKRKIAKNIGFGTLYGLTDKGLVARSPGADITVSQAKKFIRGFFNTYPEIAPWQEETRSFARRNGYCETELGRRRYIISVSATSKQEREKALRECINFPIQGGAADFFKLFCIFTNEELKRVKAETFLINQVHDEIDLEGPPSELDLLAELMPPIVNRVRDIFKMDIPVPVDLEYGYNWGELVEWKEPVRV